MHSFSKKMNSRIEKIYSNRIDREIVYKRVAGIEPASLAWKAKGYSRRS